MVYLHKLSSEVRDVVQVFSKELAESLGRWAYRAFLNINSDHRPQ
jgi:hypothetical protein